MKKYLQYALLVILISSATLSKANYQISLLTCDKGDASYAAFGHTAIRIIDSENHTDLIYNFGMFRFSVPNFTWKFIMGDLKYWLGVHKTDNFLKMYAYEHRAVWEQKLSLDHQTAKTLVDTLKHIYKPENRYYYYHFLEQNCTTEARNVLFKILNKSIDFEPHITDKTYRNILDTYLTGKPWTQFGIHIIMGANIDKNIDSYQYMALPETLLQGFEKLHNQHPGIVGSKQTLLNTSTPTSKNNSIISPFIVFSILLIIKVLFKNRIFDFTLWLLIAIIAFIIIMVWQYSAHMELQNNWNILWASPTYLLLILLSLFKWNKPLKIVALLNILLIAVYIIIQIIGIQSMHFGVWPLIMLLLISNIQVMYPNLTIYNKHINS